MTATVQTPSQILLTRSVDHPDGVASIPDAVSTFLWYEPKAHTSEPKNGATNVGNASKSSSMLKSTGTSSKKGNIATSNSYYALENEEAEEDEEPIENVYDESANLFPNLKTGESSSITVVTG
ncbi:hypothetical protein Tco_1106577 [Tanacetum coccineum]